MPWLPCQRTSAFAYEEDRRIQRIYAATRNAMVSSIENTVTSQTPIWRNVLWSSAEISLFKSYLCSNRWQLNFYSRSWCSVVPTGPARPRVTPHSSDGRPALTPPTTAPADLAQHVEYHRRRPAEQQHAVHRREGPSARQYSTGRMSP